MLTLRLFHQDDPFTQLGLRTLGDAPLTIGRDAGADWTIDDPSVALSRLHCVVTPANGYLMLRDTSANGTYLGDGSFRLEPNEPVAIGVRQAFRIGPFILVADDSDATADFANRTIVPAAAVQPPPPLPVSEPKPSVGALLDAFCAGAGLDCSAFSGEPPEAVLARAGEVYRQLVDRLSELVQDRAAARDEYAIDRTTIGAVDNNPFKWATPDRLATDLLRARSDGFLTGSPAVAASFGDVRTHLLAITEAGIEAQQALLAALSPATIEADAAARGSMLRSKAATSWDRYVLRHAELAGNAPLANAYARRTA